MRCIFSTSVYTKKQLNIFRCIGLGSRLTGNTPDSQSGHTFVQLTAGYKTPPNVEISCAITVQRRVNYRNLINNFVYRNHVDYYSLSFTFHSEGRPSAQIIELGLRSSNTYKERIPSYF